MRMAIIGTGYVGTVTGACFAELGHQVVCADVDAKRIKMLNEGRTPFFEHGIEPLIKANMEEGRLSFVADNKAAVKDADVIFICVGTPPLPNGKPDLKPLEQAIKDIAEGMTGYTLVVERSTLPIKTGDWLIETLSKGVSKGVEFDVAAVPQFLREGHAVQDFMEPSRIIIGANTERAQNILTTLHKPLNAPILLTDINSAELIKHATNAFLAMKISFINSLAQLCEKTDANIDAISKGMSLDKRISSDYLQAGVGYGGIFFPKDIASLVSIADEYHLQFDLIKAVDTVNRYQRIHFVEKIETALDGNLRGKTVCIWGLAYRPHTDDMRDAPSITIIRSLQKRGAKIRAFDPLAIENTRKILPDIDYFDSPFEAAQGADAIAVLTNWSELEQINFMQLKEATTCRLIVDGRNLYPRQRLLDLGFDYICIGKKPAKASEKSPMTV
ncbi:MAG: UDP-glucose/GDP-mannose dehydrogenase family protein [Vampirovibrionales bacterium]